MPAALSGWSRAALTSLSAKPPPEKINRGPNHKDENQWLPHDRACPLKRAAEISGAGSRRSPGPPETEWACRGPRSGALQIQLAEASRREGGLETTHSSVHVLGRSPSGRRVPDPGTDSGSRDQWLLSALRGVLVPGGPGRVDPKLGLSRAGTCRRPRVSGRGKGQPESGLEG